MPESMIINNPILNVLVGEGTIAVDVDRILDMDGGEVDLNKPWIGKGENFTAEYNCNYYLDSLGILDLYLPETVSNNSGFSLFLKSGGWVLRQRDLESIQVHDQSSTLGVTGSINTFQIGSYTRFVRSNFGWLCLPNEAVTIN
jgi:hypothetical protein